MTIPKSKLFVPRVNGQTSVLKAAQKQRELMAEWKLSNDAYLDDDTYDPDWNDFDESTLED